MVQVILSHTIGVQFMSFISNTKKFEEIPKELKSLAFAYGLTNVEPFFMMAAFLYVQSFFKDIEVKKFNIKFILKNILRRYLRYEQLTV